MLQDCPGPLSADVVFNESGAHFGLEGTSIGSHWLTPGNFGPNQASRAAYAGGGAAWCTAPGTPRHASPVQFLAVWWAIA